MTSRAIAKSLFILSLFGLSLVSAAQTLKIMPLGNSITRGTMCTNGDIYNCIINPANGAIGYRYRLDSLLQDADYNIDMVGPRNDGWGVFSETQHAGFDGLKNEQIANIMETGNEPPDYNYGSPLLNLYSTHIILLHSGSNNILNGEDDASGLNRILDAVDDFETASGQPVLVFVAKITRPRNTICGQNDVTTSYNNNVASLVQTRINAGDKLVLVDMECASTINYFTEMADYIHPAQGAYNKMADVWFSAINSYNSTPVISSIPEQSTDRGTAFPALSLDNYVDDAEDNDQDLSWSWAPLSPANFNVSIDANRRVTVSSKNSNWSGSETITFTVEDQGRVLTQLKKSASIEVSFTVKWIPEIIGQQDVSTNEDSPLDLKVSDLIVVEPDKAPGGMNILISDGPNYSFSGTTITPDDNFYGDLTVPVRLSAGGKVSNSYDLTITVNPVNDPPHIISQARELETIQNSCLEISTSDLNVSDLDDAYPSGFSVIIQPGAGYTHSANQVCPEPPLTGNLNVSLKVSDGSDLSEAYVVQVMVQSLTPGFILPVNLETNQGVLYDELVIINHYDPPSVNYTKKELPAWLSLQESTGRLYGTPENADVGDHEINLGISDGSLTADTSFIITVNNVNDPPQLLTLTLPKAQTNVAYEFQIEAEDMDVGDVLNYTSSQKPEWLSLNESTGMLSGVPMRGEEGIFPVSISLSDGEYTVDRNFNLEVEFYNNPPEFISDPNDTVVVNTDYLYGAIAEDYENDPISYFSTQIPGWAQFFPENQVLFGTPAPEDFGPYLVVLGATDGIDTSFQYFQVDVVYPTGAKDRFTASGFTIYPNPASSRLFVRVDNPTFLNQKLSFTLTDISGRTLFEKDLDSEINELPLTAEIRRGLYIYRILSREINTILKTGKLIIQ